MLWFLLSPFGATVGLIFGFIIGLILYMIGLLPIIIKLLFQLVVFTFKAAFFIVVLFIMGLTFISKRIRNSIYHNEFEL